MPYVQRDPAGKILALTSEPGASGEILPAEHPEVLQFLSQTPSGSSELNLAFLMEDLKMIRAIEDVIDLLISKNVIIFSELPVAVQQKILKKRGYRERLFGQGGSLIGKVEDIPL